MRRFILVFLVLFTMLTGAAIAQDKVVKGKVTQKDNGEALAFVNVVVKGTSKGTQTDMDGNYQISVPSGANELEFSFIGMKNATVTIDGRSVVDVVMESDAINVADVVVVGYGSTLKREFTGAATSVSAETIAELPVLSVDQALQGQAPGVQIVASSGTPGGGITIRVRGQTSVSAGNNPLFIVDGVPVQMGDISGYGFGGQNQNPLALLNPEDIASIDVLKDAAATAIYGSRAANGVVLITTKRGKEGKSEFTFQMMQGTSQETNRIQMTNSEQWALIRNEARTNQGLAPLNINTAVSTDWMSLVFRKARIQQYDFSARGGDKNTRYFMSVGYRNDEGILRGSGYERLSTRINIDHNASDKLKFGTSLNLARDVNFRINNDNNIYGVLSTAILTPPNIPVYDDKGNYSATPFAHPLATAIEPRYNFTTYKLIGNFFAEYKIMEGLNFRNDIHIDYNFLREDVFEPAITAQGAASNGYGYFGAREAGRLLWEPVLTYNKVFAEKHNISAVAGGTMQESHSRAGYVEGIEFYSQRADYMTYIGSAALVNSGSVGRTISSLASVFGRVNYSYDGKYLFSASLRRDGSSRFGKDKRWGTFYSVSAGWVISDEDFMKGLEFINLLKLRASYGVVGNQEIGNFGNMTLWSSGANGNYLGRAGIGPSSLGNPLLQWEQTAKFDLGIDASFLENRFNVALGYYNNNTTALIFSVPITRVSGFGGYTGNIGKMNNNGIEVEIGGVVIDSKSSGFKWKTSFNTTYMKNKLVELLGDGRPLGSGFSSAVAEGQPMNTFWALEYLGVDPQTGNSLYKDVNGDGLYNQEDYVFLGTALPRFYGGWTNTFSYKGFQLDILFQYQQGNKIYNNNYGFTQTLGQSTFNQDISVLRRAQKNADGTYTVQDDRIPRAATGAQAVFNNQRSSRFLFDGSYLRLRNIALTYNLPKDVVSKAKLRSAKVMLSAQNLLTFTKYPGFDPEVSMFSTTNTAQGTDFLTFPQAKMYTATLTIGF